MAGKDKSTTTLIERLRSGYGIIVKTTIISSTIFILKLIVDHYNIAYIPINSLVTAFMGGVFFTVGVIFTGVVADYKEAEKIPSDLAAAIRSIFKDSVIVPVEKKDQHIIMDMQENIKEILYTINGNFKRGVWKLGEINEAINKVNTNVSQLAHAGTSPNLLIKMRNELTNIDRSCHRISTIEQTSFIPAAYTIASMAIASVVLLLLLTKPDFWFGGPLLTLMVSSALISMVLLIEDMDNPFEVGKKAYANVDLSQLYNLEEYWKQGKY